MPDLLTIATGHVQLCSLARLFHTKWKNIPFGKSVRVFTILFSTVKMKLVLLLYLSCVSAVKELRLKNSPRFI